jgi:hypothetical protein
MSPFVSIFSALSASICRVRWYRLGACYSRQRRLRTLVARPGTHAWSMCAQRATRCGFIIARRPEMRKCLYTITRQCRLSEYSVLSHCIAWFIGRSRENSSHTQRAGTPVTRHRHREAWGRPGAQPGARRGGHTRDGHGAASQSVGRATAPTFTAGAAEPGAPAGLRRAPTQCSDLHTGAGGTARAPTSTPPEAEPPPTAGGRGHGERTGTTARAQRAAGRAAAFSWRFEAFCRRSDEVDRHVRRVVAVRCCRKIMIIDQ